MNRRLIVVSEQKPFHDDLRAIVEAKTDFPHPLISAGSDDAAEDLIRNSLTTDESYAVVVYDFTSRPISAGVKSLSRLRHIDPPL